MAARPKRSKTRRGKTESGGSQRRPGTEGQGAIRFYPRPEPARPRAPIGAGNVVMYPRAR